MPRTKILDIQVRAKDALDQIAKYRKEVADAMARQKELKKSLMMVQYPKRVRSSGGSLAYIHHAAKSGHQHPDKANSTIRKKPRLKTLALSRSVAC